MQQKTTREGGKREGVRERERGSERQ